MAFSTLASRDGAMRANSRGLGLVAGSLVPGVISVVLQDLRFFDLPAERFLTISDVLGGPAGGGQIGRPRARASRMQLGCPQVGAGRNSEET